MINSEALMRELRQTFQAEAVEHLETLNMAFLALEIRPEEHRRRELVKEAFRAAHSLKGAARAVSLSSIEHLANAMENALEEVRNTNVRLEADTYDVLYDVLDAIKVLLEGQPVEIDPLVARLTQSLNDTPYLTQPEHVDEAPPVKSPDPVPAVSSVPAPTNLTTPPETPASNEIPFAHETMTMPVPSSGDETIRVAISKLDNLMAQVGEMLVLKMNAEQRTAEMRQVRQQFTTWQKVWRELEPLLAQVNDQTGQRLTEVLTRYQEQFQMTAESVSRFDQNLQQDTMRLGIITSQIQDNARRVRMVPFETLVPGFQRTVRDAAHSEGKRVVFQVQGSEIELDKKVLEALKDPFLHLLRNSVGHGIEAPEVREKLGKPAEGQVTIQLQQRGTEVHISVRDDGAGFDLKRLRQAGNETTGYEIDDRANATDIIELAFLPGVTTTHEVTALSGRGIGLDVVRQQLEAVQGRISVDSLPGAGSTIHLFVPTTLTMSRGLLVQVGDERYVLPLHSILKIIEPQQTFTVAGQTMITVEDVPMPLVPLASLLERPSSPTPPRKPLIVIMAVAEQRLALLVDDILTEQELAVKPLGKPLQRVRNVAGTALMGDGRPVVILNAADMVRAAKGVRKHAIAVIEEQTEPQEKTPVRILVVDDSITTRTLEKNILETAGYEVITATDGAQALQRLNEHPIDLIVSDVEMPVMDGITLTRRLRENEPFKDLPLILVTSLESQDDRERGMVAGADAYIVKRGFDQAELLKTVQRLILIGEDE